GARARFLLAQVPLKATHHHDLRADLALQEARVAGDVDERSQQRRDARAIELLGDEFIAFSDRLLGGQQVLTHRVYSSSWRSGQRYALRRAAPIGGCR